MSWGYLHMIINHFPIVGAIIGSMIIITGLVFKNDGVKFSGLGTIVFAALMSVIAYLTGDSAENAVQNLPEISKSLINRHEDIATISMYLMIPSGLLASLTLYSIWKKEKSVIFLLIITLVFSVISSAVMVFTGHTGGQIRHSEFRSNASEQYIIDHQNKAADKEE
jgi:uncharacterized membrane protein